MRRQAIALVREWNDGGDEMPPGYADSRDFQLDVRAICAAAEAEGSARSAIRDFLKAIDRGYLGTMPDGFNSSAFVTALRVAAVKED